MKVVILILTSLVFSTGSGEVVSRIKLYYDAAFPLMELIADPSLAVLKVYDDHVDVLVSKEYLGKLEEDQARYEMTTHDVALCMQHPRLRTPGGVFGNYYRYSEIRDAVLNLQANYPTLVDVDSLATRSIENRALYSVKISTSPDSNNGKPEVLFTGTIHAYEPIGPSVCMNDMTYLCENYAIDPEIKWLVDNRQIHFIPVLNPDGYVFNETYPSRMWRKNRRLNYNGSYGVDLNRNYPYQWGYDDIGSSPNPSAWNYRGETPASEPETRAVIEFVNAHQIRTWHNFHAPGDVLLIPFSYINSYPWEDTLEYYTICREETARYGFLDWGNSSQAYGYPCNGELGDWAWCDSATNQIFGLVPEIGMDYWDGLNDSSVIVDVCQRMLDADLYLTQVAGFYPVCSLLTIIDTFPDANNDGCLNPGERAALLITIHNRAVVDTALALCGCLHTPYPFVQITDTTGGYGDVIRLTTVTNTADPFILDCDSTADPYTWVHFNLRLNWDAMLYEKNLACSLQIGPATVIHEHPQASIIQPISSPTIFKGSIPVPGNNVWSIFDVAGRRQDPTILKPGIYFIVSNGTIVQKVIKVK